MITTDMSFTRCDWTLDPGHSIAEFHVRTYWGLTTVHGRFNRLAGGVVDGRIELVVDVATLDTGNSRRDRHLASPDFFDAELHPQVTFHSTHLEEVGDGRVRVEGELEVAGERARIELEPSIRRLDADHLEIDAQATVDQRDLGMTYKRFGIRTPATLCVRGRLKATADRRLATC